MKTPSINELPDPPAGRKGWPWTEEPEATASQDWPGQEWPCVTVVTPSYNQAEFLEATLRSVLLQGYPDLEYIVMDGGSTDGSVEIIERYAPWLSFWSSERDRGQSHAINKGFRRATGEILAWLNSDDIYYPGTLRRVAGEMTRTGCDILLGAMDKVELDGRGGTRFVKRSSPRRGEPIHTFPIVRHRGRARFHFIQPPAFWTRNTWEETGELDERYHYVMDREWCNRALANGAQVWTIDETLARFLLHSDSKSRAQVREFSRELVVMYLRFARLPAFHTLYCLFSSLKPAQRALSHWGREDENGHGSLRSATFRLGARFLSALRRALPGLHGAPNLQGNVSPRAPNPKNPVGR